MKEHFFDRTHSSKCMNMVGILNVARFLFFFGMSCVPVNITGGTDFELQITAINSIKYVLWS